MPININFPDFLRAPIQQGPFANLAQDLASGLALGLAPEKFRMDKEKNLLANELTKAKTETEKQFGGLNALSGAAREYQSLEVLKRLYGQDSPIVKSAEQRLAAELQHRVASAKNMESLVANASKRYASPFAKPYFEEQEISQGIFPGTSTQQEGPWANVKLSTSQRNKMLADYGLSRIKQTTDPFTRRGLEQAQNIHITKNQIDPSALVGYSGWVGGIQKYGEMLSDQFGSPSDAYKAYQQSKTAAQALAKQYRQVLGESISSEARNALEDLVNPESWHVSPEIALSKYNTIMDILDQELETFYKASEDPKTFNRNYGSGIVSMDLSSGKKIVFDEKRDKEAQALSDKIKKGQQKIGLKTTKREYTEEDLKETARRKGKTVAEIKQIIESMDNYNG